MTDLPPPNPGDIPPPDPATRASAASDQAPAARSADETLGWVSQQHIVFKVLLWAALWWVFLPLKLIRGSNGSTAGMAGALAALVAGGLFMLVFVAALFVPTPDADPDTIAVEDTRDADADDQDTEAAAAAAVESQSPSPSPRPSPSPPPSPSPSPSPAPSPSPSPTKDETSASTSPRGDDAPVVMQGRVVDIVDGDTFDLSNGTRVRIAIADTPEVYGGIETCGPEASDFAGSFLAGQTVAIYRPVGAPEYDRFDRRVGEAVRVSDGASLGVALVKAGLATVDERFTDEDPDLAERLRAAAAAAEDPNCESQQEPEPEPEPTEDPGGARHGGNVNGGYECHPAYYECLPQVGDLNCRDVGHSVTVFDPNNDPYGLDGNDKDGNGCESKSSWSSSKTYPYY